MGQLTGVRATAGDVPGRLLRPGGRPPRRSGDLSGVRYFLLPTWGVMVNSSVVESVRTSPMEFLAVTLTS